MHKIVYFFILDLFLTFSLYAKEPTTAILDNVVSNEVQQFHIGSYGFRCVPYGVLSLEKLYTNSKLTSVCQKSIYNFYKKYPNLKYYSQKILKTQQMYHIEFKNQECILYALGEKTLSELLLENGLAVRKPIFRDEEFKYLFYKAQLKAKTNKYGMWKENIINDCIVELYK
jgi:hypothetical protein